MDYISDISFIDSNKSKISFQNLNSAEVKIIIFDKIVIFPIADFIDILKLLTEITERS
jgi:hypothetical protein